MYVQNQQITDPAIINPFLTRRGYNTYFSTAATQTITETLLTAIFGGGDSVSCQFRVNPNVYLAKKRRFPQQNGASNGGIQSFP